jgi:hypothetical protein
VDSVDTALSAAGEVDEGMLRLLRVQPPADANRESPLAESRELAEVLGGQAQKQGV